MARSIYRTAILTIHDPTRHVRAVLEQLFRDYTAAYTECLHVCAGQYDVAALMRLATRTAETNTENIENTENTEGAMDKPTRTRASARTLSNRLFSTSVSPQAAHVFRAVAAPLESRLRQSLREHVAQTLLSYAVLYQRWESQLATAQEAQPPEATAKASGPSAGRHTPQPALKPIKPPSFPRRFHARQLARSIQAALEELATLGDSIERENLLKAQLQRTRQSDVIGVPIVGFAASYGAGLYFNPETNRFYARLDIVGPDSHLGRPITARGRYLDIKTNIVTVSAGTGGKEGQRNNQEDSLESTETLDSNDNTESAGHRKRRMDPEVATFGRGHRSILVPLEMGRWHEWTQRWSIAQATSTASDLQDTADTSRGRGAPVAFLPQRGGDSRQPTAGTPASVDIVRRVDHKRAGGYRYELHVAFKFPRPESSSMTTAAADRPLLAINRGFRHLYAAVVTTPDASQALACQVASGAELLRIQERLERNRQERQRRGVSAAESIDARRLPRRDRRQSRISDEHCAIAANEIVTLARQYDAQIVMEDLSGIPIRGLPYLLRPLMHRRQWEKLAKRIEERLEAAGLPPGLMASANHISQDCPRCGERQDVEKVATSEGAREFTCEKCGATQDRDVMASANIARRWVWICQRGAEKREGVSREELSSWESFAASHPVQGLQLPEPEIMR